MPITVIDRAESVVAYGDASMPTPFLRERSGRAAAVLLIAALVGTLTTWVISWIMHDWSLLSAAPQSWAMQWLPTLVPNIGMSIMTSLLVGAALWQHTSARTHLLWTATAGVVVAIIYGVATKSLYVSQVATVSFVPPPLFIVLDVGLSLAVALAITIAYEVLESRHMPHGESRD
jgi:hypothetical protein